MRGMSLKKATVIYGVARYSTIIIQLVFSAVLARLLTPADYGIVAVITVFTTLFQTLSNLGLGTAVTQYQDLSPQDIQDIFTFSEYFSIALMIIFALLAYPIAFFYGDNVYVPVTLLLTLSVFFSSLNMIPNALLLKEKKFMQVGSIMIGATVCSGLIGIGLAFLGAKYYALVVQSILSAFIQFVLNYRNTNLKIKFKFSYDPIKYVKNYSTNQFLYNIINYFAQNLDNLLTGKLMGNEMLAYYNKGYTLMRYPVTNIAHVITPVLHPILAEHQKDRRYIYDEFIKVSKIMSLLGVFIMAVCFWADTEIIICYFGNQWYDAVSPFKWLCVCMPAQLLNALFGSIYQSTGCTKQMLQSGCIHIPISLLAIIIGAYSRNITILAILVSASMYCKFFIESFFLIRKSFNYSIAKFLKVFIPDVVIGGAMFATIFLCGDMSGLEMWQSLIIKVLVCSIVFLAMLLITKQMKYFYLLIPQKLKNKIIKKNGAKK